MSSLKQFLAVTLVSLSSLSSHADSAVAHRILETRIEKAYNIDSAHKGYDFQSAVGRFVTLDLTAKEITMQIGTSCPRNALCIWSGVRDLHFAIASVKVNPTTRAKLYKGELMNAGEGVHTTLEVYDYSMSKNIKVPAMTVIRFNTQVVAPNAPLHTSVLLGDALSELPNASR